MAPPYLRTADDEFADLADFPYAPHYLDLDGLRMHYVDEGPRNAPVVLMMHGMPTWSYLYRHIIPAFLAAGYRCVAPDHIGFGRSDKVTDPAWYDIARHTANARALVTRLDLRRVTLMVQDWGGPTGLAQYAEMPDRFERLVVMNTWLHHEGYEYTEMIQRWRAASQNPEYLGGDMPAGQIVSLALRRDGHDTDAVRAAYDAPFTDYASKAGIRRFPFCLPFAQPLEGNAADQQRCYDALTRWDKPAHLIFGDEDGIFTYEWAQKWAAAIPGATHERIEGAGHFVQEDAPDDLAAAILRRLHEDGL